MANAHEPGHSTSILGYLWLALFFGLIAVGAKTGLENGKVAQVEIEKQKQEAEKQRFMAATREAHHLSVRGQHDKAIELLEDLTKEYPKKATTWMNLGAAQFQKGAYSKAIAAADKGLALSPDDWDVMALKAASLVKAGELEKGMTVAEKIPANKGRMSTWLRVDPTWNKLEPTTRLDALRTKHGLRKDGMGDTGINPSLEIDRQRRAYPQEVIDKAKALKAAAEKEKATEK